MVEAPPLASDYPINSPEVAIKLMADILKDYDREVVAVINLRPDMKPINMNIVSIGALDQSLIHPRELMKSTILSNASRSSFFSHLFLCDIVSRLFLMESVTVMILLCFVNPFLCHLGSTIQTFGSRIIILITVRNLIMSSC